MFKHFIFVSNIQFKMLDDKQNLTSLYFFVFLRHFKYHVSTLRNIFFIQQHFSLLEWKIKASKSFIHFATCKFIE